jgi:HEAT repeat protein
MIHANLGWATGSREQIRMNDETEYYLNEAKTGDFDAAYHGLIELPSRLLPDLEEAYRGEADPEIRALIVEAVWQHRSPSSVDFLAVALEDPHPDVWKQALDGLVRIASPESRKVLELAKSGEAGQDAVIRAWIQEAIDQIDERASPGQ